MNLTEKTLSVKEIFKGRIITVTHDDVLLPDGKEAKREVVRHPGGVCVAPLTDKNEIIFVRQYRYPYGEVTLELPAGKLERGEDITLAAKRELSEETGAEGELIYLGEMYPTPGYVDEIIRLFVAPKLSYGDMHTDEDEFIETVKIPLDEAVKMALDGSIKDGKTLILIFKINEMMRRGQL